jgi:hypothetical protein
VLFWLFFFLSLAKKFLLSLRRLAGLRSDFDDAVSSVSSSDLRNETLNEEGKQHENNDALRL